MECELGARPRVVNQWQCSGKFRCGRSRHWRQNRHLDERGSSSGNQDSKFHHACSPAATSSGWWSGPTEHLVPRIGQGGGERDYSKRAVGADNSTSLEFWMTVAASTPVFQERHLLHELVFANSHSLPQQPQISFTILCATTTELDAKRNSSQLW